MKILVVGSGAREHALVWKLCSEGNEVLCAPGNPGTQALASSLPIGASAIADLVEAAEREAVDLVVVGPEAPLVAGLADALAARGIATFGPSREAARLEGSKVFSKEFMARQGIPTADFALFSEADAAIDYIRRAARPLVVKADGLAAGKGVVVAKDSAEAEQAVRDIMLARAFGDAGAKVVIEECLRGQEVSFHVVADGENYVALAPAQDHKAAFDGDRGPNTGGMGAYSPPPVVNATLQATICKQVVEPTLAGMASEGRPFRGVLFLGLMIVEGEAFVLEYNVRFGDPECEVLLPRLGGSLSELLRGAARHQGTSLSAYRSQWEAPAALAVVLASGGYPGPFPLGKAIRGLEQAQSIEGVQVFHAGTKLEEGELRTAGGRVLTLSAIGADIDQAAERAYRAADAIDFEGKHLRRDIGWRARVHAQSPGW